MATAPSTSRPRCWPKLEAGTLVLNDLGGKRPASLDGASPALRAAVGTARGRNRGFRPLDQGRGAAPHRPVGRRQGQLQLVPQARPAEPATISTSRQVLLQRELDRSLASLRLEEVRNRAAPPIAEISDPAAYRRMARGAHRQALPAAGRRRLHRRPALLPRRARRPDRRLHPAGRAQFLHPRDRARPAAAARATRPTGSSSRGCATSRTRARSATAPPLFNIYEDRSEGFATAMEEMLMQAGLYDDIPHGRELVWVDARQPRRARPRVAARPGQ